ncbi:MAG: hypothetical protein PWP65_1712 [Clostridia bacterium]|nr:hypothetical protein [Clostridia bacterium]
MKPRLEELCLHLNCMVPVYGQGDDAGNYTELWLDDGNRVLIRNKTKTVLHRLAELFGVSIHQRRAYWRRLGYRHHEAPLVFGPDLVFISLRLRRPRFRDEGGSGYAVLQKVKTWEKYTEGDYRSRLIFHNGDILPSLLTPQKIACRLKEGEEAQRRWQELVEKFQVSGKAREEKDYVLELPGGRKARAELVSQEGSLLVLKVNQQDFFQRRGNN